MEEEEKVEIIHFRECCVTIHSSTHRNLKLRWEFYAEM